MNQLIEVMIKFKHIKNNTALILICYVYDLHSVTSSYTDDLICQVVEKLCSN